MAVSHDRSSDDRLDLIAALAVLEPEFRAAAVACDMIGMSMDEAAEALGVPAGTVKSRLHRARARLAASWRRTGRHERYEHETRRDARRLREQAGAQAPPDLAGEVMKRVRSEPRRRPAPFAGRW